MSRHCHRRSEQNRSQEVVEENADWVRKRYRKIIHCKTDRQRQQVGQSLYLSAYNKLVG